MKPTTMSDESKTFTIDIKRVEGYNFMITFGNSIPALITDESQPLGIEAGPNPSMLLAAAVGNCLCSSLLFCLQKTRVPVKEIIATVKGTTERNESGRWRIKEFNVEITPFTDPDFKCQLERCSKIFEDFCVVSKSVERGIPIKLTIKPP